MVKFVPYDENAHRSQFFELNVEYVSWVADETQARHDVDVMAEVKQILREYVEAFLDDFLAIRPPKGIIYVLEDDGNVVGMGALKELEVGVGEIKRMYIRPEYRRRGLGKQLLKKLMEKGKEFGYSTIRLSARAATEKAYGTCHVALGQNTWLGGKNECSLHWDFLIDKPTVTIDDQQVLKEGMFTI